MFIGSIVHAGLWSSSANGLHLSYFKKLKTKIMKKESLSLMVVKTLLTVLLFTGVGTIIVGGGYIVGEYYKNKIINPNIIINNNEDNEVIDLNIITNDQGLIFEKILCEPGKDYIFDYGIEGDKPKLPCRDCPNGYFFKTTYIKEHFIPELKISRKTEIKNCVKRIKDFEYRTISELNEKDIKVGNYNTEGYLVWESICVGISRVERSVCAIKPKEIVISKYDETIDNETELTNDQLRIINPGDGQIEIGSKYRFSLKLEEIGSDDNKFKCFKGIGFEKIENDENKIDTSDWQTYRNEEFGFEIDFPITWKDYIENSKENKVSANRDTFKEYSYQSIYFLHPQKISNEGSPGEVGFVIGIFDKENWLISEGWKKIGENDKYIFGSSPSNSAAPDDMLERYKEISSITSTFKFIEK